MEEVQFEEYKVPLKIKLSALWSGLVLMYHYGSFFDCFVPQLMYSIGAADWINYAAKWPKVLE